MWSRTCICLKKREICRVYKSTWLVIYVFLDSIKHIIRIKLVHRTDINMNIGCIVCYVDCYVLLYWLCSADFKWDNACFAHLISICQGKYAQSGNTKYHVMCNCTWCLYGTTIRVFNTTAFTYKHKHIA